jgi:hypothetical protein
MAFDWKRGLIAASGNQALLTEYDTRGDRAARLRSTRLSNRAAEASYQATTRARQANEFATQVHRDPDTGAINYEAGAQWLEQNEQFELAKMWRENAKAASEAEMRERSLAAQEAARQDSAILDPQGNPTGRYNPDQFARSFLLRAPAAGGVAHMQNWMSVQQTQIGVQQAQLKAQRELMLSALKYAASGDGNGSVRALEAAGVLGPDGQPVQSVEKTTDGSYIINGQKVTQKYFSNWFASAEQTAAMNISEFHANQNLMRQLAAAGVKEDPEAITAPTSDEAETAGLEVVAWAANNNKDLNSSDTERMNRNVAGLAKLISRRDGIPFPNASAMVMEQLGDMMLKEEWGFFDDTDRFVGISNEAMLLITNAMNTPALRKASIPAIIQNLQKNGYLVTGNGIQTAEEAKQGEAAKAPAPESKPVAQDKNTPGPGGYAR